MSNILILIIPDIQPFFFIFQCFLRLVPSDIQIIQISVYRFDADYTYNKAENQLELLQTVLTIFQALINNIELYMKIQTEFTTVSSAYKNLRDRIDELEKRIAE